MSNGNSVAAPRLCHVIKVDTFDGYGFNLHAEKGKPGQYIGKVDDGSPAETAGLRQGDRIIEVNGVNIANENHKQVVNRIKTLPGETKLLVVTPGPGEEIPNLDPPETKVPPVPSPVSENGDAPKANGDEVDSNNTNNTNNTNNIDKTNSTPKLNLSMTAAEMRAQLAARKKVDPKKVPMDLKSKFDIVKKL